MRRSSAAWYAVLLLATPTAAIGQGVPTTPRDSAVQRIEPQVVRGQRGATVMAGASALVVRTDSLRTPVSASLADMLRTMPLLLVRTNSRGEAELSVRGSESRQISVVLDGLPLSPGWDGRVDPSLVPTSGISRLTYVRSTASVLGGPNTLGGLLDLELQSSATRGPEPRLSFGTDETGAQLLSGSYASGRQVGDGHVDWRVGGGMRDIDGLVRAKGVTDIGGATDALRVNTDTRSADAFGAVTYRAATGAGVSALVSGYDATRGVAPELHSDGPRLWRYPGQSRRLAQLRLSSPFVESGLGRTQFEASGGMLQGKVAIESFTDATYSALDGTERGDERVGTARLAATHRFAGGPELRLAVTSNTVRYDETIDADPTSRYRQALMSAGAETQWLVGSRTLMSAGVVYDRAETKDAGGRVPLGPKDHLGWRLGTTVQATSQVRLHASASSRARFPALRELYSGALNRFEPNPALRPEHLLAAEAGVSVGDPTKLNGVVAQVIGFHHWLDDGIVRVGVPATNRFQRVNRDEMRTLGIEAITGWRGGAHGPSLTLDLVAQRVTIHDLTAGGAERRPEHMPNFRAMVDGTLPLPAQLMLGASLARVGSQYCIDPDTDADVELAGQSIAGVTLHREFGLGSGRVFRFLRVLAGMDNVTNAAMYEQCGLPRAGRTLRIGVDLR